MSIILCAETIVFVLNSVTFASKNMAYNIFKTKNPNKKYILFVCLGNICRSPAAEGIMKQMVYDDVELRGTVEVDSAGIGAWHTGQLPDHRMREHAAQRGFNLNSRARQVQPDDFDNFDLVFGMDEENIADLRSVARNGEDRKKIRCLADYLTAHPEYNTVPDPYYGSGKDFDRALDLIEDACREVARRLKTGEL